MIKVEEAIKIIKENYPGNKPLTCLDYDNKYIFTLIPEDEEFDPMTILSTEAFFVDKNTGSFGAYISPRHGTDEFVKQSKESQVIFDYRKWF